PEYPVALRIAGPFIYLAEEVDPGSRMAFGFVLVVKVIKRGTSGRAQLVEKALLADVEDVLVDVED
ncbi:hypothetical protein N0V85_010010, partial [Neurospora sp. IMI 360204]